MAYCESPRACSGQVYCTNPNKCQRPKDEFGQHLRVHGPRKTERKSYADVR